MPFSYFGAEGFIYCRNPDHIDGNDVGLQRMGVEVVEHLVSDFNSKIQI